ncbi:MAG: 1,3-beta-galactosyl-N-acetylhexosamine phosphorylase [Clostridia bacterium]|nr:1,3-beta-galactosyl-N-acetylhexosamine phosphorylase [Clostridia bacterium]
MAKGRVTIPTDKDYVEGTKRIAALWGADAVRDCDGTTLPKNALEIAEKVYNTYFVVRGDNAWADAHRDELQNVLLMSDPVTATDKVLKIDLLKGYYKSQLEVNEESPKKYWQVFDRTTDEEVFDWHYENGCVTVENAAEYHEYTVNFFAKNIWDSTQMYNYVTNGWTGEKHLVMEPRYEKTFAHIQENMQKWCEENDNVNVVRFTTFLYHFFLVFNEQGKEKHVDWFGYPMTASPRAFDAFEAEYGYAIKSEDIVKGGSYSSNFTNPDKKFTDYMEFVQKYVTKTVRALVDIVHSYGKEAMMFLGDSWIGTEPYGEYFKDMHLDAVVGSVGGGVTVRMLSEIPHVKYHEGRFLPYFFPDTFFEGNEQNAIAELNRNWVTARRAMMRKPLDRMGFGGYLALAAKFPRFIERAGQVCDEFRKICDAAGDAKPYQSLTVAILNSWGKLRSWQSHMVAHELWYQQIYSYQGVLEALSGLGVDVKFISFDDIRKNGVDKDIDVIINVGDEGTAFSGGDNWKDANVVAALRRWVAEGHGFIGVGEPTAYTKNGKCFALSDVLGVDKEKGFTLSEDKYNIQKKAHFITEDIEGEIDYGEGMKNIYALGGAEVLDIEFSDRFQRRVNVGEVKLAANEYGKGRGVYIAGLPYSAQNARLLLRAAYWSAHKEAEMKKAFSSNPLVDCSYYPESKKYALVNNADSEQRTTFYDVDGNAMEVTLGAGEIYWKE